MERNLTDWYDGSLHSPLHIGWYNVVLKCMFPVFEGDADEQFCRRRYWNGTAFSGVVFIGDSEWEQERCQAFVAASPVEVFWRGCTEEQFQ